MNEMDELIEDMTLDIWRCGFIGSDADADRMWGCMNDDDRNVYRDYARAALAAIHARGDRVVPGVGELVRSVERAEAGAGTLPAKDAVKLRPEHWHAVCREARALASSPYAPEKEPAL
jgi:hypothetical protein